MIADSGLYPRDILGVLITAGLLISIVALCLSGNWFLDRLERWERKRGDDAE